MGKSKVKLVRQKEKMSSTIVITTLILIFVAFMVPLFLLGAKDDRKWKDFLLEVKDNAQVHIANHNIALDAVDGAIFLKEIIQGPNYFNQNVPFKDNKIFFTVYTDKKSRDFVLIPCKTAGDFVLFYGESNFERGQGLSSLHSEWLESFLQEHDL